MTTMGIGVDTQPGRRQGYMDGRLTDGHGTIYDFLALMSQI